MMGSLGVGADWSKIEDTVTEDILSHSQDSQRRQFSLEARISLWSRRELDI